MGYDINSFFDLFDGLPKFPPGTDGDHVFKHFIEIEDNRLPIEAFIGLKIDSILTKICVKQKDYIIYYNEYKRIVPKIQGLFNALQSNKN